MKVQREIKNCRECQHSTNSAHLHDDPFTSGPASVTWYCQKGKEPSSIITDAWKIDKDCPIKKCV